MEYLINIFHPIWNIFAEDSIDITNMAPLICKPCDIFPAMGS